jgi:hypothetical protein
MQFSAKHRGKCGLYWGCRMPDGRISLVQTQNLPAAHRVSRVRSCSCVLGGQYQTSCAPFILHCVSRCLNIGRGPRIVGQSQFLLAPKPACQALRQGLRIDHRAPAPISWAGRPQGCHDPVRRLSSRLSSRRLLDSLLLRLSLLRLVESLAPAFAITTGW